MYPPDYIKITINTLGATICLIILFFVATSKYGKEKRSKIFARFIFVYFVVLISSAAENLMDISVNLLNPFLTTAIMFIIPVCGPILLLFFTALFLATIEEKTVISKSSNYAVYTVFALCAVDIISAVVLRCVTMFRFAYPMYYFMRNDWLFLNHILSLMCMCILTILIIAYKKFISIRELLTLLSYLILPTVAVVVDIFFGRFATVNLSLILVIVIYYASIQVELAQAIKQKEIELIENKVYIMLSQIKPHFLYNALSAIAQLCDDDPIKAKKATVDFSTYLRCNMESLDNKGLIRVEKEIDHVKGYLALEKAIYGKALNVVYKIEAGGFLLPSLTIQPITENAVKHGIGKKEGGGTITVKVCESGNEFHVIISDNGRGYDTGSMYKDDRSHIGIENVKQRLKEQCRGTLEISSEIGKGTTAVIKIPKQ